MTGLSRLALFAFAAIFAVRGGLTLLAQIQRSSSDAFDVISVKPSPPQPPGARGGGPCGGGPAQIEPARFALCRSTAYLLISWGYGLPCARAEAHDLILGGPGWLKSDQFDIQAVIPAGTPTYTREQFRDGIGPELQLMIRNLLADRFKMVTHQESREKAVYALTVAKNGSKLQPFEPDSCDSTPPQAPLRPIQPGQKRRCSHILGVLPATNRGGWKGNVTADGSTIAGFTDLLSLALDRPIIDRTGMSGLFDFSLDFSVEGTRLTQFLIPDANQSAAAAGSLPSIFTAVQDQLGLKLEATKGPVDTIVIDQIEKPTKN